MFNISDTYFIAMIFVFGCVCAFFISWIVLKLILRIRMEQKGGDQTYPDVPRSFLATRKVLTFVYSSEKTMTIVWIIVVMTSLHLLLCLFFLEAWNIWRGHVTLFWGTNLAVVAVAFLALTRLRYGKVLAWVFGLLAFLGVLSHFSKTPMWQEWKASINRPAPASVPVAKAVELPRGTLKMKAGEEKDLMEKTGWPEEHVLEARNVVIDEFGLPAQFDIWDNRIGKCGEFRKSKYTKRGTYCLQFPTEKGEWVLTQTGPADEYEGWCFFVKKGEKLKVPVKFFVER